MVYLRQGRSWPFRRYSMFAIAPLILAAATPGMAAPILYTVAGTGSGTLNGEAFDDQAIAISLIADPDSDIASFGLAPTSQTVQIGSLGMFDFTNQVYFGTSFANVFYLAGVNTTRFVADFLDVQLPRLRRHLCAVRHGHRRCREPARPPPVRQHRHLGRRADADAGNRVHHPAASIRRPRCRSPRSGR